MISLTEFISKNKKDFKSENSDLIKIFASISKASKLVHSKINIAGLVDILGTYGEFNIQGEQQQKLDIFADNCFINAFKEGGGVCGVGSEENDNFLSFQSENSNFGNYVVLFDPLDGSSNIDVNISVGTIFSIYKRISSNESEATLEDMLQKGIKQIAAGYTLYGSSTMLVFTTGNGVNGFTLNPSENEFFLSHSNIQTPKEGKIYSINQANTNRFAKGIKDYIDYCETIDQLTNRPYTGRYVGSLVSDFHRNLIKGGIYIYPSTTNNPEGRLRLLYECNPLAFIAEQAGGLATDGKNKILHITPNKLHQRSPLFIGSENMVKTAELMYRKNDKMV